MNFKKDYYSILGISRHAKKEEIKAAWRKQAIKYHPDKNPGNAEAEDRIKEINEAYEVLYGEISRGIYDEYRNNEEKLASEKSKKTGNQKTQNSNTKNKRTYEKKTVIRTERKIYIRGTISVKYWGEPDAANQFTLRETNYRINPVSAEANIVDSDIHAYDAPLHFQKAYTQADLFITPLPQPIKCKISTSAGEELYALKLEEIRIVQPKLYDITKHETQSLGTLKGEFFAYVLRIDEKEVVEVVTECYGETGRTEAKTENGFYFTRKEFYHKDCTTFWSPWQREKIPATNKGSRYRKSGVPATTRFMNADGCAQWWWIAFLIPYLIIWPKFFLILLALALGAGLISAGINFIGRLIPFLLLLFVVFSIFAAFRSDLRKMPPIRKARQTSSDSVITRKEPVTLDTASGVPIDTLIHQYIAWRDYDSTSYAITLSVSANSVRNSAHTHESISLSSTSTTLSPVYNYLERSDQSKMQPIFSAFDSIGKANNLSSLAFAKMIVSCIQSVPYYLVLDRSCDANRYDDEFIVRYLQDCKRDCCIGNEKFGVRSPIEFISDLKGDCDTRALILYSLLKSFGYKVALITSEYYKHAMIAVSFEDESGVNGLAMNINNHNYYLWETTSAGFPPGQVLVANQNLFHWNIALLNEK